MIIGLRDHRSTTTGSIPNIYCMFIIINVEQKMFCLIYRVTHTILCFGLSVISNKFCKGKISLTKTKTKNQSFFSKTTSVLSSLIISKLYRFNTYTNRNECYKSCKKIQRTEIHQVPKVNIIHLYQYSYNIRRDIVYI